MKGPENDDVFFEVHKFKSVTKDTQWLTLTFPEPIETIRYVRIETISSPSWIGWKEIEVIADE